MLQSDVTALSDASDASDATEVKFKINDSFKND
jgi:hypothetical protein